MRVLLLCPPPRLDEGPVRPRHAPLYAIAVAAAVRAAGHEVVVLDEYVGDGCSARIVAEAVAADADLLLLSHSDYNRRVDAPVLDRLIGLLRAASPRVPLLAFARLSARFARQAMAELPSLPGLCFSEPERPVVQALARLEEGGRPADLAGIPGSAVRTDSGAVLLTEAGPAPLTGLPLPAWDLIDVRRYGFSPHQQEEDRVWTVLASRGCPYPCFYCEVQTRPAWILRPVDEVLAELRALHDRFGARSVFFGDPTFAVDRAWALELCRRLPEEGPPGLRWSCMSRTDRVDPELLQAMADAGCWNILFGVESLNEPALRAARKQLDPETVGPALRAARAAGIETIASIMIGLPGDGRAGFLRTLERLIELEPDYAQFFITQLGGADAPEGGALESEWDGSRYDFFGRVYLPEGFSGAEELRSLRRHAFRRFYLRPAYIARTLRRVVAAGKPIEQLRRAARGGLLAARLAAGERPA